MTPLRVAAFTQGENVPSARFRVRQHLAALAGLGVAMREWPARHGSYPPPGLVARLRWLPRSLAERHGALRAAAREAELGLFQRELLSTLPSVEACWRKPAVFDVDDAIWLDQRWNAAARIARRCGLVLCGNAYLAEWFGRHARVEILPTAVDTERYRPGRESVAPLVVWSGSSSGHPYLQRIEGALDVLMQRHPDLRLRILSDRPAALPRLPADRVEQRRWTPEGEVAALNEAWAGLMPMPDTPWTRGKCSFKMLTYMACGVAAVVSPWGMNADVLALGEGALGAAGDDDWVDALSALIEDEGLRRRLGVAGRALIEKHYSCAVIAPRLAAALRSQA